MNEFNLVLNNGKKGVFMKKLCAVIGKYFGIIAVIFLILGMTIPGEFKWVLGKTAGISTLSLLLGIIMFGMGMTMFSRNFWVAVSKELTSPFSLSLDACSLSIWFWASFNFSSAAW